MAINCRATLKADSGKSPEESFKIMLGRFRKKMTDAGILTLWKKHQYYESKGEKRRRKRKEAKLKRLKDNNKMRFE